MKALNDVRRAFAQPWLSSTIAAAFRPKQEPHLKRNARKLPRPGAFAMEPMEPRMLLSSDFVFNVAGINDIRVESDGTDISIVDVGANTEITSKAISDTSAVRIVGSAADDTIRVDLTTDFDLAIFISDTGGSDTLEVVGPDAVQWSVTGNDAGSADAAGGIRFSSIENLQGGTGNRDTFLFGTLGDLTGSAGGGTSGFDTLLFTSATALTLTDTAVTEAAPGTRTVGLSGFEAGVVEAPSLSSATFSGMSALTTGLAQWTSQGPGPITGAQPRIPAQNNPVTGAVQDVALNPNDLSSLFVGTVGGGVWKNSDISVLFASDSAVVDGNAVAEAKLAAFADFLKANPTLTVQVVGHTDNTGTVAGNNQLAVERADAVRTFLMGLGIEGARLIASGQGQSAPVDTNATDAGKANNRRVELLVNHWIPLTDQFPSLSISALAISPRDAFGNLVDASTPASDLVLFAATGSTSSGSALFNNLGATTSIGILKSTDGGATWQLLDQLAGSVITSIQVLASGTVVASTNAASGNGLFVSTNGGESFVDVAAARVAAGQSALFDRKVSDLVKDPGNPLRVYAAVPRVGVFVSNDEGQTWTAVNNAGLENVANAKRIVLNISPTPDGANHPLYVALIGDTQTLTANAAANALSIQVSANTVIDGSYGGAVTDDDTVQIWGSGFDGVDNDGDGLVDALDPKERPATATDGIDNDGDGLIDAEDPAESGLFSRVLRIASVGPAVGGNRTVTFAAPGADGLDNNNDGNVDEPAEAGLAGGSGLVWGAGASIRVFAGSQHRLFAIFRTDDVGANWTAQPAPGTTDGAGGFHGVHSGAQGDTHFAMVVDPANPDVLYVGGDAQPMTNGAGNQAGAVDFGGRWLRFDGAANWQPITDNGANNTAPHADSRNTVFRGIHLVEVDDGGIYELRNAGTAGAGRTWRSLNDDLTLAEFYSLAYDPAADLILGGLQDNGDALQSATDSVAWNAVAGGDGSIVAFSNGNPIFSSQNLGGFTIARAGITAATAANATVIFLPTGTDVRNGDTVVIGGFAPVVSNVQAAGAGEPANSIKVTFATSLPNPLALGTIARVRPPLTVVGVAAGIQNILFTTPIVVNRVTPTSLLIGTHGAYESSDVGRNLTLLGTTTGTGSTDIGEVHTMVYGGVEGGANKGTVIWLGTNPAASSPQPGDAHALWLRNATSVFGDPVSPVQSYTDEVGTAVMDIAVDPTDWRRVFVLDASGRIWFSPNAGQAKAFTADGAAGTDRFWRELTSDIGSLPGAFLLQQIVAEKVNGNDVVLVGGQGGVFRRIADGPWHEYGVGLPNALTTVLERVGGTDDMLLQGTFGRGAWTLDLASQTLGTPTELTIKGTSGDDEIVLRRNAIQPWLLDVFLFADGQAEPDLASYSVPFANLTKITIDVSGAGSGNDDILIDGDFGSVVTSNGTVQVIGGGGSDSLTVTPSSDPEDVLFAGTLNGNAASGSIMHGFSDEFGDFDLEEVSWTGLASVNGSVVAQPSVEGVADGLKAVADALTAHLGKSLQGQSLAGIDAESLARALNGVIVERLRPKEQAFVSASQVPGSNVIQIDNGSSVLLRLLEAGGLDLSVFQGGSITDPAALEAALEALDGTPNNTSHQVDPPGGDPSIVDDLLFLVHADALVLEGVVELETLGSSLELTGLLDVSMTIDLDLAFGFDSKGFFIRTTGAILPTITITDLEISGEAVGLGTLGFLGVEMSKGTLTLGAGVELKFTLGDPATVDDNLIRVDELLAPPNPTQLVTFTTSSTDPATPDLVLNATLDVAPILPGVPAFTLATADIKVSWTDIANPLSATAPQVGVVAGADVLEFLRFVSVSATQVVDTLSDLKDTLEALYGAEIPYLSDTVTELVDLVTAFEDKVLDPLTGGANFELPSIQALVRNLSDRLGVAASQFGLAYDKVQHELTYRLQLTETLFQVDKALGAGFDLAGGLADLEFNADAKVTGDVTLDAVIGLDLDLLATPDDAFFLRNASVKLDVDVSADDIEATARFGFLSIGIDEGTLTNAAGTGPANLTLTVSLLDPGTGPGNDGRTSLSEILANLDELGKLVGVAGGGSMRLMLPVETTFVPGLGDIPDGNPGAIDLAARSIIATLPDLASPSSFNVTLGPAISLHVGNFKNIDAAGVVGALGQLTYWFDQFRNSPTFAAFDVPLLGPVLDNALQVADAFRDKVLIDDNDNGLDDSKTLLFDLNAALAEAGLEDKLFAANLGGKITLIALDSAFTSFTVAGAQPLGFGASQVSSLPAGQQFHQAQATTAFVDVVPGTADDPGILQANLAFTVAAAGRTYNVKVNKSSTDDNTRLGDDRWKLIDANNDPNFRTAQQMIPHLVQALGIPNVVYHDATQSLTFSLDLTEVFFNLGMPLNFNVDEASIPDFLSFQTSGALSVKLQGNLNLEVGIFLGNAQPSDKLATTTPLANLNEPLVLDDNQRYTADVIVGKLELGLPNNPDATFKVFVNGAVTGVDVTVTRAAAADNKSVADVVADLNAALQTANLNTQVEAQAVPAVAGQAAPQQVQFVGKAGVTQLKITTAAGGAAAVGFGLDDSAEDTNATDGVKIVAEKPLPALKGRLTADATFDVVVGGQAKSITLTPALTDNNDFTFSLINDLQTLIDPVQNPRVVVGFTGGALTFTTTDGSSIAVTNANAAAQNQLGIVNRSGNSEDILVTLSNNTTFRVSFDSTDTTIAHIIDAIETASILNGNKRVLVTINDPIGSALVLQDLTFSAGGPNAATFRVQMLNSSTAGLLLGLVGQDGTGEPGDELDGKINGADIAALTALDRFFITATPAGQDPLAGLTLSVGTPSPVTASARFGFVDLGLQGDGTRPGATNGVDDVLLANLSLRLKEPTPGDGRVSLAEMLDGLDQGFSSLFDLSLTGSGQLDLSLTPATVTSLANLGINVSGDPQNAPRIELKLDMTNNVFGSTPTPPDFTVTPKGFDELDLFGNLEFNFDSILAGLAALVDFLDDFEALSFLNDPIPVIDVSVKDLVGVAQRFADAVEAAQNDPAGSLQVLRSKLLESFGLPPNSPALNLLLVAGPTAGSQIFKIDTHLETDFSKSLPINLDLDVGPLELGGDADLLAEGSLSLDLDFGFDIADPTKIYVFNTTGIAATLNLAATDLDFKAAVGPLGVFIQDGEASINGTLDPADSNTVLTAGFQGKFLGTNGMAELDTSLLGQLGVDIGGELAVTLPVYFPTESVFAGDVKLTGTLAYANGKLTASLTPDIPAGIFDFNPANLSLLDQLLLGVDGVDLFLEGLEGLLDGTLGGFTLPMVGDKLAGAADAIGDFRDGFVESFRKAIEDLANPALAFAQAGIGAATGGASLLAAQAVPQGVDPVSKLLFQLLGPSGLGFVDSTSDIVFDTNIQTESDPGKVYFDWDIHMGGPLANADAGIGFDLGIPGLGLETEGDIQLNVDWALDLGFGLNFTDGFYLDIADGSELEITATVTTPGLGITGRLGFLQIEAEENVEADEGADAESERGNTGITAQFAVDIINRQDENDEKLGFAELGRIGIDAKIAAQALADLAMQLKLNSDLVPNPGNFPSVVADFVLDWSIGTVDDPLTDADEFSGLSLSELGDGFLKSGSLEIAFDDIGLDLGKYFSDVIGPIVDKVQEVTAPIKPFLDFLTEPIPVISDLAGPTSLLDIAAMSGAVNPGLIKAIEVVDQVIDIVNDIQGAGGTKVLYVDALLPGGSLVIYQSPPSGAFAAAAATGVPNFDPSKPVNLANLKTFVEGLPSELGFLGDALGAATDAFSKAVTKMRPGGAASGGFSLPIIEDPSQIFGMLLGQPADLVTFTMAPLEVEAEFSAFFSILGPLGVSINAEFGAIFGPFTFGYDTFGITQFAASDFNNPELLLDGLYVGDLDAEGNDIPELQFDAGLWAAAELNLGIARGGVGGGLFAEIDFNLYDPDDDGKVRISEILTTIDNEIRYGTAAVAPLAIFDISGKLTAELFAFLKIDFGFFVVDEKILITPPIELLSFENVFTRYPSLATELDNGVLQLNMGKNAEARVEGDLSDVAETFYVKQAAGDPTKVLVWAPQFGVDEVDAQEYSATNLIIASAGEGDDRVYFSTPDGYGGTPFSVTSNVKLEIHGDAGNDIVVGTLGTGAALLVGGAGDDALTGGSGDDTIFGGTGTDTLKGLGGKDWIIGDGDHEEYLVDGVITVDVKGSDAKDFLHGGEDADLIIGAGGDDFIRGDGGDDVLIGDGGELTLIANSRLAATTREIDGIPSTNDPARLELAVRGTAQNGKGAADDMDGGGGNDHLYGGFGNDVMLGGANADVIYGELGSDTVDGQGGSDVIFGDFGVFNDVTVGNQTLLEPFTTVGGEKDVLKGGADDDKVVGGAGDDKMEGGGGNDQLWGGVGRDQVWGDDEAGGETGNDKLYGQADSDVLRGGLGDDYLEGGGGNDDVKGWFGKDKLVAGYGSDTLDGEEDGDIYEISVRGGSTTELTTAYDSGLLGIDNFIVTGTPGDDTLLLRAMADAYFPTLVKLHGLVDKFFASTLADRLAGMLQSFNDAYGPWDAAPGLYAALTAEYQEGLAAKLKAEAAKPANKSSDPNAPTQAQIDAAIDEVLESSAASKIEALQEKLTALFKAANEGAGVAVPSTLFSALIAAYKRTDPQALDDIRASIDAYYVYESLYPALGGLKLIVSEVYADTDVDEDVAARYAAIVARVTQAYPAAFAAELAPVLEELQDAMDDLAENATEAQQKTAFETAISDAYLADPTIGSKYTDTAFVAVINDGGKDVERFNYRSMEGMVVNAMGGDDYLAIDDLLAAATINLGDGNDRVQIGQVFKSERVKDFGENGTGIEPVDPFTTVEITRGWLSNGVSVPTTIYGGSGDDRFTVFHNVAVLNLNGDDGDDVFTVRAFALRGSTDNERARTDMKGDGGADTILYVLNAPVGIDGGDGFDTVRIVGTEFGDDFVVTDSGVFGAGLNVSYVNIERLVADGAEGDDRFFVMSTGLDVVTEIDGGLGSDTFFVGGNPARAPVAVVSNDLRGHSGIILHSVTAADPADAGWAGLPVEGVSANVADNEEAMILLAESGGRSFVVEGATGTAVGAVDSYRVRLSRSPGVGKKVSIAVVPNGLSPELLARNYADLEVSLNGTDWFDSVTIELTGTTWDDGIEVKFRAKNDVGLEGRRFTFINHKVLTDPLLTTDASFLDVQMRSLKVQMEDDDVDGVVIVPVDTADTTVLENGFTDQFQVMLTRAPDAGKTVTVKLTQDDLGGSQVRLNGLNELTLTFDSVIDGSHDWNVPVTVTVTADNDAVVEGFHTEYIRVTVTSDDVDQAKGFTDGQVVKVNGEDVTVVEIDGRNWLQIDGNPSDSGLANMEIPGDKPTTAVFLPHRPIASTVFLRVNGGEVFAPNSGRFSITGSTLNFLTASGAPEFRTGKVEVSYLYTETGYHGLSVRDHVVDIIDNDTPTVIVRPAGGAAYDGMVDVVEGDPNAIDTYTVRLSQAPTGTVQITIDSKKTRTTWGGTAYFENQLELSKNGVDGWGQTITLSFNAGDWSSEQTVYVRAFNDDRLDGNDTQVFAPDLQTVNKIRGPLIIEGAAGAGSLTLPAPLMMPWETNVRQSDGNVVSFTAATQPTDPETMVVEEDDLKAVILRLQEDNPTLTNPNQLVGATLEMSRGKGTAVVLDEARPEDLFDRFWLITAVSVAVDHDDDPTTSKRITLTLKNPTAVDPTKPSVTAPDSDSEYAITQLSVNFFADEREQVDYMFMYDSDSVSNDSGALTSSDGVVLGYVDDGPQAFHLMTVETSALQRAADLLGLADIELLKGREITITVGPGQGRLYKIEDVSDPAGEQKVLTLSDVSGSGAPTNLSEFRIAGSDRYGRIVGFGMGPNILFSGRPQGGGITYGDLEVVQVELGRGNDTVRVDYTTNAEDHSTKRTGDYYTQTILRTGGGDDTVTVTLANGDGTNADGTTNATAAEGDGAIAIDLGDGTDTLLGAASTRSLVVFGGLGEDTINTGGGDDIVIGDQGRVDYSKKIVVDGTTYDVLVTRLGYSVPQNPVNPNPTFATSNTISDTHLDPPYVPFPTDYDGLLGLSLQVISPEGHVQFRTVIGNTASTITVDAPWEEFPVFNAVDPTDNYFYRISSYPDDQTDGLFRGPRVIWSVNDGLGAKDTITTGAGDDVAIGGAGGDDIDMGEGNDRAAGDAARFDFEPVDAESGKTRMQRIDTLLAAELGGVDTIRGAGGQDLLIGGAFGDKLDGGANEDLVFGDNVTLTFSANSGAAVQPRFVSLTGPTLAYDAAGAPNIAGHLNRPGGNPAWGDWQITLDQSLAVSDRFGNDSIAGGAHDDTIFGQRGNDTIQGDGSITLTPAVGTDGTGGWVVVTPSVEDFAGAGSDGDDYIEGNDGADLVFGNLGQDDIVGGSSSLFSLVTYPVRGDVGRDVLFGGAGTRVSRNNEGAAAIQHGRDADVIAGDNANIYRVLNANGSELRFNYDSDAGLYDQANRIDPRAVQLLDYTPGGPDFTTAVEGAPIEVAINPGTGLRDQGQADEVHGEGGDDAIYGMVGNDALYGDQHDDVVIGGYGDDWISGGTGDDGILGDDGRLLVSRNSTLGEPLYGVAPIPAGDLNRTISAMNNIQFAIVNVTGQLKYTADLEPDNLDPAVTKNALFRPVYADDIIYGGWGTDAIHGGAGDDAISGAEAMGESYANNYDPSGTKLNAQAIRTDFTHPVNPGNVLGYQPTGANATKFAFFDAANGLGKILIRQSDGALVANGGAEWLLNFANEGPNDTKWVVGTSYANQPKPTDGDDHIFGDLGNDWMVGGSGRDTMWAGWGDDLMNGDDVLSTSGTTDTNPSWEDLMYGGAGLDVMLINTNGDRAIDWIGEFNSYYTPFAQFGMASVLRLIQPDVPQYLLDLSKSQGADQTLAVKYNSAAARNGEPFGELGMVLQEDAAFGAQSGSPRDSQAGNSKGKVDVNRSAGNQPLYLSAGSVGEGADSLDATQLAPLLVAARDMWAQALGDDPRLAALDAVTVQVGNLEGDQLALMLHGTIYIDADAAGHGWFIDASPTDNSEYLAMDGVLVATTGDAAGRMDLLSALAHELGHVAGLSHEDGGVMDDELAAGTRTLVVEPIDVTAPGHAPAPTVVWDNPPVAAAALVHAAPAAAPIWIDDFLNHRGKSDQERNPNASLRISVPVAMKSAVNLKPELGALNRQAGAR